MTSYFDEQMVEKRVTRQFRRRFSWTFHLILVIGLFLSLMAHAFLTGGEGRWGYNFLISFLFSMPFMVHTIHFIYRELYESTLDRAMRRAQSEGSSHEEKRKHDDTYQSAPLYLSDDGELVEYDAENSDYIEAPQQRKRS